MAHFAGGQEIFLSRYCMACGATQMLVCSGLQCHSFYINVDENWSIRSQVEMEHTDRETDTQHADIIRLFEQNIML
jgi:hypothetical protein